MTNNSSRHLRKDWNKFPKIFRWKIFGTHNPTCYISVLCMWCVRSLEEDVAAFAESLSLKDEIVKSLTLQLADIRDNGAQSSCVGSSNTAHTLLETTHRLEQLSVFHSHLDYTYGTETCR